MIQLPLQRALHGKKLVLGSASPRRAQLLRTLTLELEVRPPQVEEIYPSTLPLEEVPLYLSKLKADSLRPTLASDEILITADTVVLLQGMLIGKPANLDEARTTLQRLSGHTHEVVTGYTITNATGRTFTGKALSEITFTTLHPDEIEYYLTHYEVLDKAGAYGVQDWIGLVGVESIRGSYNNIMGLPTMLLYRDLLQFVQED